MTQERHDSRASQISDRGLVYAYQMCILHIQKDPGYFQMQREYMMLLNIMDTLSNYDVSSDMLTTSELRYLFELSTLVLSSEIQEIIRYNYTGTPLNWILVEDGLIVYRKGLRTGMYVIDKSEDGGFTWELDLIKLIPDEDTFIIAIDAGIAGMRQVVRGGTYCIDMELTPLGFDGAEDTDWENIFNTNA
jgi:hypothetical protein